MALRRPLEADFEHFWALPPKWLSGSLWRLILSISGPCSYNSSQEASASSFSTFGGLAPKIAPRALLQANFQHFRALLCKWCSGRLWMLILNISTFCVQRAFGRRWSMQFYVVSCGLAPENMHVYGEMRRKTSQSRKKCIKMQEITHLDRQFKLSLSKWRIFVI